MQRIRLAALAATICSLSLVSRAQASECHHASAAGHERGQGAARHVPDEPRRATHARPRQHPRVATRHVAAAHSPRARSRRGSGGAEWRQARARARLARSFRALDRNHDRRLSRRETRLGLARFRALDRDRNGYLSRRELRPSWQRTRRATRGRLAFRVRL